MANLPTKRPYHSLTVIPHVEQKILELIGKGWSLKRIGDKLGVTDSAIFHRVMALPEYRRQLDVGVELRMDRREQELENAATNVDVTRADRLLGHARWIAERSSHRWAQKQELTGKDGGPIQVEIVQFGRTIEGEVGVDPIADAQSSAALPKK